MSVVKKPVLNVPVAGASPPEYAPPAKGMLSQPLKKIPFKERLDELYADAAEADRVLGRFIVDVNRYRSGVVAHAKLKERATAEAKLRRYGRTDDPAILNDVVRATIYYDSIEKLYAARDYIKEKHRDEVALDFDRYEGSVGANGYRDVKFMLKLRLAKSANPFHYCELQLNIRTMDRVRKIDHALYEIVRQAGSWDKRVPVNISDPKEKAVLAAKMRAAYVAIKQNKIGDARDLECLKDITFNFFQEGDVDTLKSGDVKFSVPQVEFLDAFLAKVYKAYEDKALTANSLNGGMAQRRRMLTPDQAGRFVQPKR